MNATVADPKLGVPEVEFHVSCEFMCCGELRFEKVVPQYGALGLNFHVKVAWHGKWRAVSVLPQPTFAVSVLPQLPKVDVLEIQLKGVEGIQARSASTSFASLEMSHQASLGIDWWPQCCQS